MTIKIVGGLLHLNIPSEEDQGFYSIGDDIYLSNSDAEIISKEFFHPGFIENVGSIETQSLLKSSFVFRVSDTKTLSEQCTVDNLDYAHEKFWGIVQGLLLSFWFVKDNSVNLVVTFLSDYANQSIFSKRKNMYNSLSSGKYLETILKKDEVQEAVSWLIRISAYLTQSKEEIREVGDVSAISVEASFRNNDARTQYSEMGRFSRALRFIQVARSQSFLPVKIASYIGALESILEVDLELSHQVSERAAKLVGGDLDKRVENYNLIKESYDVRSKYVHGSNLSKRHRNSEHIEQLSMRLDSFIRSFMQTLILNHSELNDMKTEDLNVWFKELILKG